MADHQPDYERLEAQFTGLELTLGGLEGVTNAFRRELEGAEGSLKGVGREASGMSRALGSSLKRAFEGVVFDGKKLSEALSAVGRSISGTVLNRALAPVQGAIGRVVGGGVQAIASGLMPFETGGALAGGRVAAFARGGVINAPTLFPMRSGIGMMGEAGPEAILPLARGADGRLGIRSGAGPAAVHVTMNISTPDVAGFERSRTQIAAEMSRALQRGGRNL